MTTPDLSAVFVKLGLALGLGLLVGLQRERAASAIAGFRTFPLATALGTLAGLLAIEWGALVVGAGLVAVAALIVSTNLARASTPGHDHGLTTEIALLVMYAVGAYLAIGEHSVAIVVAGAVAVLLHLKPQLHALANEIDEADFRSTMQFVLISLVILPVLPNQAYGPYGVLNPQKIWWMVVLITGMSLAGYVGYRFVGERAGVILSGSLGGLISSTATTVSYARRTKTEPTSVAPATAIILLASTVAFIRILAIVAAVQPASIKVVGWPLGSVGLVLAVISAALWFRSRHESFSMSKHTNPTELRTALVFSAIFAAVLLGVAAARSYAGQRGLYVVAVLSGLTDMDAITLSTAQLARNGQLTDGTLWRLILAAALANLVFKAAAAGVLGSRALLARVAALFGIALCFGLGVLFLWP